MEKLIDVFRRYADREFIFVRPGGNWGDYLIYWGVESMAEKLGIKWIDMPWDEFDPASVKQDQVVYLHGSGGFNEWCSGSAGKAFKSALRASCEAVIQGPQTCDNKNNYMEIFFSSCGTGSSKVKRIYFFAREMHSLAILTRLAPEDIQISVDHDTALYLTRDDFLRRAGSVVKKRKCLVVLRQDNEMPSSVGDHIMYGGVDPAAEVKSFEEWLSIHANAEKIISNRTHSAIAGAILQVSTHLLEGSYHKNRSIWRYSLKERGVKWSSYEDLPIIRRVGLARALNVLPKKVQSSWRLRKAFRWVERITNSDG